MQLRGSADAILVGRGTWENDHMTMLALERSVQPLRCVVSRKGDFDLKHPLFYTPGGDIHLLVTENQAERSREFPTGNVTVHHQSLAEFIETLATHYQVNYLHCEGGGELIRELAALDWIDDFHVTFAGHTLFGGQKAPTATGIPRDFLPAARSYKIQHFEAHPELRECFVSYSRVR